MSIQTFAASAVEFDARRWYVKIRISLADGSVREFVASADDAYTEGSGIWFGTKADYDQIWERL